MKAGVNGIGAGVRAEDVLVGAKGAEMAGLLPTIDDYEDPYAYLYRYTSLPTNIELKECKELSDIAGWSDHQSGREIISMMEPHLATDGVYIIWYWAKYKRPTVTVTYEGKRHTFVTHKSTGNPPEFFLKSEQKKCSNVADLIRFHVKEGIVFTPKARQGTDGNQEERSGNEAPQVPGNDFANNDPKQGGQGTSGAGGGRSLVQQTPPPLPQRNKGNQGTTGGKPHTSGTKDDQKVMQPKGAKPQPTDGQPPQPRRTNQKSTDRSRTREGTSPTEEPTPPPLPPRDKCITPLKDGQVCIRLQHPYDKTYTKTLESVYV